MPRILIVDDEAHQCTVLGIGFKRRGFEVETISDWRAAIKRVQRAEPALDVVVTDLRMEEGDEGLKVLEAVKAASPNTPVIISTAFATAQTAVEAMRSGAYHYLIKPVDHDELEVIVNRALERRSLVQDNITLRAQLSAKRDPNLLGKSSAMDRVLTLIGKVAGSRTNVLITGDSGTGKELVARAIHRASAQAKGPFVPINCGAIPENLVEAELFGSMRGAYTGSVADRIGLCEEANGGTLFLDEIAELPLQAQVKMLRMLQERSIRPVGGRKDVALDVRVLAATNRSLKEEVANGTFREDLFFRLNVVEIPVPSLRARRDDIPLLIAHFIGRFSKQQNKLIRGLTQAAERAVLGHSFPGNVRELENIIERGVTLCDGDWIDIDDLPPDLGGGGAKDASIGQHLVTDAGLDLEAVLADSERAIIRQAMELSGGVKTRAAELLGLTFRSFRYRHKKLFEEGEDFSDSDDEERK
jgi:two-component system response regulator PilR (NtrC family)